MHLRTFAMATFHVPRRNVHLYLVAIFVLAALTVLLSMLIGHKPILPNG